MEVVVVRHQLARDHVVDDEAGERDVAGCRRLGEGDEVGANAVILRGEPRAEAAEAGDHLVGEEQDAVFVDDALHLRPIGRWRNLDAAGALHRLAGKGCDVLRSDGQDLVLERARGAKAELVRRLAFEGLAVPIGIHDVAEALIDRVAMRVHVRHAAHRACGDGRAVIGVLARDDDAPLGLALEHPIVPDQADGGVVRFRPRRAIEHLVEVVGRDLGELARRAPPPAGAWS